MGSRTGAWRSPQNGFVSFPNPCIKNNSFVARRRSPYIRSVSRPTNHYPSAAAIETEKAMHTYEAIQEQVRRARLERSIHVAEMISSAIVTTWKAIARAASGIAAAERAKNPDRLFTFEA
jgi:hypothetical protein